jgi:hypothetical protein
LFWGCDDLGEESTDPGNWALYRLSDPGLTSHQVQNNPLRSLMLAPVPFISVSDIRVYHWETHEIEFTPAVDSVLDSLRFSRWGSTSGRPFVVVVGNTRIYLGTFWWAYSSSMPLCPYIETLSPTPRSIQLPPMHQGEDPRADRRIYLSLKKAGVLDEDSGPP